MILRRVTTLLLVLILFASSNPAFGVGRIKTKPIKSTNIVGYHQVQYMDGNTETSEPLWSANFPTRIKINKDRTNIFEISFKTLVEYGKIQSYCVRVQLWNTNGNLYADNPCFHWNPGGSKTKVTVELYPWWFEMKSGQYYWTIQTLQPGYFGYHLIELPLELRI